MILSPSCHFNVFVTNKMGKLFAFHYLDVLCTKGTLLSDGKVNTYQIFPTAYSPGIEYTLFDWFKIIILCSSFRVQFI